MRLLYYEDLINPRTILKSPLLQAIFPEANSPYLERRIPQKFKGQTVINYDGAIAIAVK